MEYHLQRLKDWKDVKFEYKTSITGDELKQMSKMGTETIPFCFYGEDIARRNIEGKDNYLIVRRGKEIVAFQVFEVRSMDTL